MFVARASSRRAGLLVVHPREVATRELFRCQFSANDYFGNEGTEAFVYVLAALLVEIPGAAERLVRGRRVRHPKLGVGTVQARHVSEGATFFVVRFDDGAVRTILADKLALLEE